MDELARRVEDAERKFQAADLDLRLKELDAAKQRQVVFWVEIFFITILCLTHYIVCKDCEREKFTNKLLRFLVTLEISLHVGDRRN